ncbi:hypothetical protein [Neisseria wadsworthii]|uniref:hypothetical protein n=1 Tax=Neisseria wadsworthii TaxID=607711 RepID=UPI000D31CB04|nr:hypothetical protein [Neisseria wadsworthii]
MISYHEALGINGLDPFINNESAQTYRLCTLLLNDLINRHPELAKEAEQQLAHHLQSAANEAQTRRIAKLQTHIRAGHLAAILSEPPAKQP